MSEKISMPEEAWKCILPCPGCGLVRNSPFESGRWRAWYIYKDGIRHFPFTVCHFDKDRKPDGYQHEYHDGWVDCEGPPKPVEAMKSIAQEIQKEAETLADMLCPLPEFGDPHHERAVAIRQQRLIASKIASRFAPLFDKLNIENVCDACAGTGRVPLGECMCRGTGKMSVAAIQFREEVVSLQRDNTRLRALLQRVLTHGSPVAGGAWTFQGLADDPRRDTGGGGYSAKLAQDIKAELSRNADLAEVK